MEERRPSLPPDLENLATFQELGQSGEILDLMWGISEQTKRLRFLDDEYRSYLAAVIRFLNQSFPSKSYAFSVDGASLVKERLPRQIQSFLDKDHEFMLGFKKEHLGGGSYDVTFNVKGKETKRGVLVRFSVLDPGITYPRVRYDFDVSLVNSDGTAFPFVIPRGLGVDALPIGGTVFVASQEALYRGVSRITQETRPKGLSL